MAANIPLSTHEAAAMLSLNRHTIAEYCRQGRLKAIKRGGDWWITRTELKAFAKKPRKVGAPSKVNGKTSPPPS